MPSASIWSWTQWWPLLMQLPEFFQGIRPDRESVFSCDKIAKSQTIWWTVNSNIGDLFFLLSSDLCKMGNALVCRGHTDLVQVSAGRCKWNGTGNVLYYALLDNCPLVFKLYVFLDRFWIVEYLTFASFRAKISTMPTWRLRSLNLVAEQPSMNCRS